MSKIKSCRQLLSATASLLVLLSSFGLPALAQVNKLPEGVKVSLEVGVGGVAHLGRVNPITVWVSNERGEKSFSGVIKVEQSNSGLGAVDEVRVTYERKFKLAEGDSLSTVFFADFDPPPGDIRLNITTGGGKVLFSEKNRISQSAEPEDALVLVIEDQGGGLAYMNGKAILTRQRSYFDRSMEELLQGKIETASIPLERILGRGLEFFSSVDVIVVREGDFSRIGSNDFIAFAGFAARGGVLVFSQGVDGPKLSNSLLGELLPMEVQVVEPTSNLTPLENLAGVEMYSGATAIVGRGSGELKGGSWITAGSREMPLILARDYGYGRVIQLNLDYTQPSIRGWPGWGRTWKRLFIGPLTSGSLSSAMIHPGDVSDILTDIKQVEPIPLRVATFFIIVYIVLVGPGNYLLLARKKIRKLLWVTIPVVVIAFSAFAIFLGYMLRGTQNILRRLDEVHVFPGVPVAPYRSHLMYFTSTSGSSKMSFNTEGAALHVTVPPKQVNYYGMYTTRGRIVGGWTATLRYRPKPEIERRVNKWTPYRLWLDALSGGGFGEVAWKGSPTEAISYDLPGPAADSWFVNGGTAQRLGALDAHGEIYRTGTIEISPPKTKGNIFSRAGDLVNLMTSSEITGLDLDDSYLVLLVDSPVVGLDTYRRYARDTATLVVHHLPGSAGTKESPHVRLEVSEFITTAPRGIRTRMGSLRYGSASQDDKPIVSLSAGDVIYFEGRISPVDPDAVYHLSVSGWEYDGYRDASGEYALEVTGIGFYEQVNKSLNTTTVVPMGGIEIWDGKIQISVTAGTEMTLSDLSLVLAHS